MSSSCAKLESKAAAVQPENSSSIPKKRSNGSNHPSVIGPEDAQESDGDDSGNICNNKNKEPKSSEEEEDNEDFEIALQRIFSEPSPMKLISAMKGSREKNGLYPRKQTVKWAADVYDPPPSIVSHTRGKKHHQKSKSRDKENHRKNSKKNPKGSNSSRGGGGKDQKQPRRNSSYCGGSFFKTNLTKVHYSVTEAL